MNRAIAKREPIQRQHVLIYFFAEESCRWYGTTYHSTLDLTYPRVSQGARVIHVACLQGGPSVPSSWSRAVLPLKIRPSTEIR